MDLAFVFNDNITNTKEAKAFLMICENLCHKCPLNHTNLANAIDKIKKDKLLTKEDCINFEHNLKGCSLSDDMLKNRNK